MSDSPEWEASAKVAQYLAAGVQVAEAILRARQRRTESQRAADTQQATALRAERTAAHAADRVRWTRATDRSWVADASLEDLGRVWGAAAGWADSDPGADRAARRVEERLTEMAPTSMSRYKQAREAGAGRVEAMRDVLPDLATEAGYRSTEPRVFVADAADSYAASQAAAALAAARTDAARPDDPATPRVDEHLEGVGQATGDRARAAAYQTDADRTATQVPTAVRLAAQAYPQPYTTVRPATASSPAPRQPTPAGRALIRSR